MRTLFMLLLLAVLLDSVFQNASHDSTSNRSEDAVVSLVASKAASDTSGYGSTESTLAFLGFTRSTLLLILPRHIVRRVFNLSSCWEPRG